MRFSTVQLLPALAGTALAQGTVTGQLGDAKVVSNNPIGKEVTATLPEQPFYKAGSLDGNVKGSITAKSGANGVGVDYTVKFSNIPKEGGPFIYHIHAAAVPANGNCTSTLAHLDPYVRGETPLCDSASPQTCQVGDLSGKFGNVTSDPFEATYHDQYASLNVGSDASLPDRSFVFHFGNKTRITCANFSVLTPGSPSNSTPTSYPTTGGVTAAPSPTSSTPVTAGAEILSVKAVVQSLGVAAFAAVFFVV